MPIVTGELVLKVLALQWLPKRQVIYGRKKLLMVIKGVPGLGSADCLDPGGN